jgi:uncharacterized integral membrane protein
VFVLAALLLLLAAVAIFAVQNAHLVAVNLLGWQSTWPLAGVVLITLVTGGLVAFLVSLIRQLSLRLKIRDAGGRLRKSETDLSTAKTQLGKVRDELEKVKAELARSKVTAGEREQELASVRAALAVANHELEETRGRAASPGPGQASTPSEGGGPGGRNPRRR